MLLFAFGAIAVAQEPIPESKKKTPVRVPVVITLPDDVKQSVSPEELLLMEKFAEIASSQLSYYEQYPFLLPQSIFVGTVFENGLIQSSDLQSFPQTAGEKELSDLAFDADGNRYRLSKEQRSSIRKNGNFLVPSKAFPNENHEWELSGLLQKGTHPSFSSFESNMKWGLSRLSVHLPARLLWDEPFSIRRGLSDTGKGVWGLTSLLVGLPEYKGSFPDKEEWIEADLDEVIVEKQLALLQSSKQVDPRLLPPEERQKLADILLTIEHEVKSEWRADQDNLQLGFWRKGEELGLAGDDLKIYVANRTIRHLNAEVIEQIMGNEVIQSDFGEQMTLRLAEIFRASVIRQNRSAQQSDEKDAFEEEAEQRRLKKHKIRGTVDSWLYEKVYQDVEKFIAESEPQWSTSLIAELKQEGLNTEASLEEIRHQVLHVERSKWEKQAAKKWKTKKKQKPARKFRLKKYHWNPRSVFVPELNDGKGGYRLKRYSVWRYDTSKPFWRFGLIGRESIVWGTNASRGLLRNSVWNGRFGLRSQFGDLFGLDSFSRRLTVDQKTGEVIEDPKGKKFWTYGTRLKAVWTRIDKSRKRFEAKKDDKFIPKNVARVFHAGWNYGIRGPLETILIGVGQPIATVGTVGVAGALGLTSYLWAPPLAVAKHGFNLALYDTNSPDETFAFGYYPKGFALSRMLLWDVGMKGVSQIGLSAAWGLAGEPALFASSTILGSARYATRSIYDVLAYGLVIVPFGRVPAQEGFFAYQVSGPGLLEGRLLQLDSALALLALQARLEQEELEHWQRFHSSEINAPLEEYQDFLQRILSPFAVKAAANPKGMVEARDKQHKAIGEAFAERNKRLEKMIKVPSVDYIRQTETERKKTKLWASLLCEEFYTKRIFPYLSEEERARFWSSESLKQNDWNGLSELFLAGLFSEEFLQPIDSIPEDAYTVSVSHPHLAEYFQKLLSDIPAEKYTQSVATFSFVQAQEANSFPLDPVITMGDVVEYIETFSDE